MYFVFLRLHLIANAPGWTGLSYHEHLGYNLTWQNAFNLSYSKLSSFPRRSLTYDLTKQRGDFTCIPSNAWSSKSSAVVKTTLVPYNPGLSALCALIQEMELLAKFLLSNVYTNTITADVTADVDEIWKSSSSWLLSHFALAVKLPLNLLTRRHGKRAIQCAHHATNDCKQHAQTPTPCSYP